LSSRLISFLGKKEGKGNYTKDLVVLSFVIWKSFSSPCVCI
jgi:hypothetical protein